MMNNTQRRRKEGWNMERSRALVLCEDNFINYDNSAFFPSPSRLQNDKNKEDSGFTQKYQDLRAADEYLNAQKTHASCKTNVFRWTVIDMCLLPPLCLQRQQNLG